MSPLLSQGSGTADSNSVLLHDSQNKINKALQILFMYKKAYPLGNSFTFLN